MSLYKKSGAQIICSSAGFSGHKGEDESLVKARQLTFYSTKQTVLGEGKTIKIGGARTIQVLILSTICQFCLGSTNLFISSCQEQ
jgi:hypothetical protein